ncbi:hypothetical protein JP0096_15340 [Helicobacter pylori]|nr:hypothetical protein JP0096_15340 [Helicobacter pylori]
MSIQTNKQVIKSLRLSKEQWQTIQTQMQEKNLNFSQLVLNSLLTQNSQAKKKDQKTTKKKVSFSLDFLEPEKVQDNTSIP